MFDEVGLSTAEAGDHGDEDDGAGHSWLRLTSWDPTEWWEEEANVIELWGRTLRQSGVGVMHNLADTIYQLPVQEKIVVQQI